MDSLILRIERHEGVIKVREAVMHQKLIQIQVIL